MEKQITIADLYRKHVADCNSTNFDVVRLYCCLHREIKAAEAGKIKMTDGLLREFKNDRRIVAKHLSVLERNKAKRTKPESYWRKFQ